MIKMVVKTDRVISEKRSQHFVGVVVFFPRRIFSVHIFISNSDNFHGKLYYNIHVYYNHRFDTHAFYLNARRMSEKVHIDVVCLTLLNIPALTDKIKRLLQALCVCNMSFMPREDSERLN